LPQQLHESATQRIEDGPPVAPGVAFDEKASVPPIAQAERGVAIIVRRAAGDPLFASPTPAERDCDALGVH
jgi:hypothetical protein